MEPQTFSVLINDTVRIDDLSVSLAVQHSGLFRTLFSLPDSDEAQRIRRGEPVCIHLLCYDAGTGEAAESISAPMLRWIFGRFTVYGFSWEFDCSLNDYCHAIQVASFLDIPNIAKSTERILSHQTLREVLEMIRPLYPNLNCELKLSLVRNLGESMETHFHRNDPCWMSQKISFACRVAIDYILQGWDFYRALESVHDAILSDPMHKRFYRWAGRDISLFSAVVCTKNVRDLYHLGGDMYLGFLFSAEGKEATPAGVFVLYFCHPDPVDADCTVTFLTQDDPKWRKSFIRLRPTRLASDDIINGAFLPLEPYCVMNENLYRDEALVAQVLEALGMTLDQIRDAQEDVNKNLS